MPQPPGRFVAYEIAPVVENHNGTCEPHPSLESANAAAGRTFWSLYGVTPEGPVLCIGDFEEYEWCAEVYSRITGCIVPENPDGLRLTSLPVSG
jgi:hypothetical protein